MKNTRNVSPATPILSFRKATQKRWTAARRRAHVIWRGDPGGGGGSSSSRIGPKGGSAPTWSGGGVLVRSAEPLVGEHHLDRDRSSDHVPERQRDQRHGGKQGVPNRVTVQDVPLEQSLR